MTARPVVVAREFLEAGGIIIFPDINMIIQAVAETHKHIRLDLFQGILIKSDISIADQHLIAFRTVAARSPGILRIDGKTQVPIVVPAVVGLPDISMERDVPLSLEICAG